MVLVNKVILFLFMFNLLFFYSPGWKNCPDLHS
jgi:hypothetical protein